MRRFLTNALLAGAAPLATVPAAAQNVELAALQPGQDLSRLSIEELAQIPVVSASKRDEPLAQAPTALFVITGEEILASAAHSLPEALRMAPNLSVQQVDARQYAISARGFNGVETANKLLVLIDGRTVYSPLASSVFWELHNRPVEDIRQIEVISGPGGTLYGPNAVNGVINVMTRDARDTLGLMARATYGSEEHGAALRYGAPIGADGAVRVYGHVFHRDGLPAGARSDLRDRFSGWQAGMRADFAPGDDHFTLQGDLFDTDVAIFDGDGEKGHNLLGRWTRSFGEAASLQVQAYYDYFERRYLLVRDSLETADLSVQYNRRVGAHEWVAGGGIRTTRDRFINNLNAFRLDPESRRLWVYNGFVQDRISLSPRLALTLGLKAEETSFTGVELLPNARLGWTASDTAFFWAAVSRAVRTPSRIDRQLANLPILAPGDDFVSEKLVAFEIGYRGRPTTRTTLSVSAFLNRYDDLRSTELSPGGMLPIRLSNGWRGHSYGIEAWSSTQLAPWWRLNLGLATLWKDFSLRQGRLDLAAGASLGDDPEYQLLARSQVALTDRLSLNAGLRWVGEIDTAPRIGDHVEADARLAYALGEHLELYVAGRNLLHASHIESNDPQRGQAARRSLFAGARVRF